jgi:excisionase family DNA binding protein
MPTANIVITPGVLGGKPHIEGRRISVQQVAEYHTDLGWSSEEIAEALNLTPAEVHAALSYYYAHKDEIDSAIREAELQLQGMPTVQDVIEGRYKLIMTVSEVAEAYGISDRTVREAIEKGWLNAQKSGGTWLIRRMLKPDGASRQRSKQRGRRPIGTSPKSCHLGDAACRAVGRPHNRQPQGVSCRGYPTRGHQYRQAHCRAPGC